MTKLSSRNPATGELIEEVEVTSPEMLKEVFARAQQAQYTWSLLPTSKRAGYLLDLRETLLNHADSLIELISKENGKPHYEALANELIPSVDILTFFAKRASKLLQDQS